MSDSKSLSNEILVTLQPDHLKRITQASPIPAISELIWNSFDADATEVNISLDRTDLRIESIIIEDNGMGIPYSEIRQIFGKLGDSWKRNVQRTKGGRVIHGKEGQGRFKAFSLGQDVVWTIRYKFEYKHFEYKVHGNINKLTQFSVSEESETTLARTGVSVEITDLAKNFKVLDDGKERERLAPIFALYLSNYKSVALRTPSGKLSIDEFIKHSEYHDLSKVRWNGKSYDSSLKICEWKSVEETGMWLCSKDGFPIQKYTKQIRGVGDLQYTAYLCSELIDDIKTDGFIALDTMNEELSLLIAESIKKIKDYYKTLKSESRKLLVGKWKSEEVYPYKDEPQNEIEEAEREIFDIVAIGLSENVKRFEDSDAKVKALQLRLLRHAVSQGPAELNFVLNEVLDLPNERLDELKELLQETTLSAIISMGKQVSNRLKFLTGLEEMIFDEKLTKIIKERSQLHKILEDNVWVFGEGYSLSASDKSLTNVLRAASKNAGIEIAIDEPVKKIDGRDGIVDLMLSRAFPTTSDSERQYLVVELKAPKVIAGRKERDQIIDYAQAVIKDLRFKGLKCKWEFLLIAKNATEQFALEVKGAKLGNGIFQQWDEDGYSATVRFLTWGQIIGENRAKMTMLSKMLDYSNNREEALSYLKTQYKKYTENVVLVSEDSDSCTNEEQPDLEEEELSDAIVVQ